MNTPRIMRNANCNRIKAFTLIELSIVLVVIGLIIGGIMTGSTLIESAALRAQVSQFEQLNSAVQAFKVKYDCLPGDCPNATNFFTFPSGVCVGSNNVIGNGDGNGVLESPPGQEQPYSTDGEYSGFMVMLNLSNLYPAAPLWQCGTQLTTVGKTILAAKLGSGGIVATSINKRNGYYWAINSVNLIATNLVNLAYFGGTGGLGVITPRQAYNFDAKIDDGLPLSGKVNAAVTYSWTLTYIDANASGTNCVIGTAYNVSNYGTVCRLFVTGKW